MPVLLFCACSIKRKALKNTIFTKIDLDSYNSFSDLWVRWKANITYSVFSFYNRIIKQSVPSR